MGRKGGYGSARGRKLNAHEVAKITLGDRMASSPDTAGVATSLKHTEGASKGGCPWGYSQEAGVACDVVYERNDSPYEAIIRVAEQKGCDLIMMASHGRRGVKAILIGSET